MSQLEKKPWYFFQLADTLPILAVITKYFFSSTEPYFLWYKKITAPLISALQGESQEFEDSTMFYTAAEYCKISKLLNSEWEYCTRYVSKDPCLPSSRERNNVLFLLRQTQKMFYLFDCP